MKQSITLLLILLITTTLMQAQVTIGSNTAPMQGALLDLKQNDNINFNSTKGLGMPRVKLTTFDNIAADIAGVTSAESNDYIGLAVYNVNTNLCIDLLPGLHVWDGERWEALGKTQFPSETGVLVDDRNPANPISYHIGKFGAAGWWMLENLRANTWPKTTSEKPGIQDLQEQIGPNATSSMIIPRYRYPGSDPNILNTNPEYGLLYNWPAATGDRDPGQNLVTSEVNYPYPPAGPPNQPLVQGICPEGWHLPSNIEFMELESVINKNPCLYGTKNDVGHNAYNMRGKNIVEGSIIGVEAYSRDYDEGGLNVLLVGNVESSGTIEYGTKASFWTSSVANKTNGFARVLTETSLIISNSNLIRRSLFSVRCKKL